MVPITRSSVSIRRNAVFRRAALPLMGLIKHHGIVPHTSHPTLSRDAGAKEKRTCLGRNVRCTNVYMSGVRGKGRLRN